MAFINREGSIEQLLGRVVVASDTNRLALKGKEFARSITAIDTGNAKRKTITRGKRVVLDYGYAQALDDGHSKQKRRGQIEGKYREPFADSRNYSGRTIRAMWRYFVDEIRRKGRARIGN